MCPQTGFLEPVLVGPAKFLIRDPSSAGFEAEEWPQSQRVSRTLGNTTDADTDDQLHPMREVARWTCSGDDQVSALSPINAGRAGRLSTVAARGERNSALRGIATGRMGRTGCDRAAPMPRIRRGHPQHVWGRSLAKCPSQWHLAP